MSTLYAVKVDFYESDFKFDQLSQNMPYDFKHFYNFCFKQTLAIQNLHRIIHQPMAQLM